MRSILLSLWGLLIAVNVSADEADHCVQPLANSVMETVGYLCLRQHYHQAIDNWPQPHIDNDVIWQEMAAVPERAPSSVDRPFSEAKAKLGEQLFFNPILSRSGQVSCVTCHQPHLAFSDGLRTSIGHEGLVGKRNSPSLVMSGFTQHPFWDGRTDSLEQQALIPIENPVEMAFSIEALLERLNADPQYRQQFKTVFGAEPIQAFQIGQALADYQRTLAKVAQNTPFDLFLRGDHSQLSDQQLHGLHLFRTKARCMNCHSGVSLSDDQFHNLGLTYYKRKYHDAGRYEVTSLAEDMGRFRTPSLRLVSHTGPWFHNGLFARMMGVLNMYNAGMPRPKPKQELADDPLFPQTSDRLHKLNLTPEELQALADFLTTL